MAKDSAAGLWSKYRDTAAIFRAEQYAKFTLPALMVDPLLSERGQNVIEHDFQSIGAQLLNNLASKILLSLFPPGQSAFKLQLSEDLQAAAEAEGHDKAALQSSLVNLEQSASAQTFKHGGQHKLTHAIKLLAAAGDCMIYRDTDSQRFYVWNRHSYAVRRHPNGDLQCAVLKQRFLWEDLDPAIQADALAKKPGGYKDGMNLDFYTVIKFKEGRLGRIAEVWHEMDGTRVGPQGTYPEHLCPYMVPTWNLATGEHYGRGLVEDFSGDFARLSLLTEQLGLYELDSLNILNLVDEAAGGVVDDYQDAKSGDYVPGKTGAVSAYERGDYNKINAVNASLSAVASRLATAFMYTGQMRDAERVTAEEVRQIAQEAEITLGGVYSLLSESLQQRLAYLSLFEVSKGNDNFLIGLLQQMYRPEILTGIPAMTRSIGTQNLLSATQVAAATVPTLAQLSRRIDPEKVIEMIFSSYSVDLAEISKSADQVAAEAQAEQDAANAAAESSTALITGAEGVQTALQGVTSV